VSRVILVHGIGQQLKGPQTLLAEWYPALRDGLWMAKSQLSVEEISIAFYGDIFRRAGGRSTEAHILDGSDVVDPQDAEWLLSWWNEAARLEMAVPGPNTPSRIRTPYLIQRALDALSHSAFFAGCSDHLMISSARQFRRYLTEPETRQAVRERVIAKITRDTRVIIAHSLGSIVAYEALFVIPQSSRISLVTLGSPLGIRHLVFDRIEPSPAGGKGHWPPSVTRWINIADRRDAVALTKKLAPLFGDRVTDVLVYNGAKAHDARPYLTAKETGQAVIEGLF
jgi:hypothetical protein